MMKPLNPVLYRALQRAFPHVEIVNQGAAAQMINRPDWNYRNGRLKAHVQDWGEVYKINCPFCSDQRKRLCICHLWAYADQKTGDDMLHLAMCHNEGCLGKRESQKELHALVFPRGDYGRTMNVQLLSPAPAYVRVAPKQFFLPESTAMAELPDDHLAIQYLRGRKFDPARLAKSWGVRYCEANPERPGQEQNHPYFYHPRIVYPVYAPPCVAIEDDSRSKSRGVRLAGWQARALEDNRADGAPKYFSAQGMKKNELLYGLTQAIKTEGPIVVVEGVTDVWRLRTNAVALFGKTISPAQCKLLLRHCAGRPIVILLDNDAADESIRVYEKIRSSRNVAGDDSPVIIATLPKGRKDPGECTRKEVWSVVEKAVAGVS